MADESCSANRTQRAKSRKCVNSFEEISLTLTIWTDQSRTTGGQFERDRGEIAKIAKADRPNSHDGAMLEI